MAEADSHDPSHPQELHNVPGEAAVGADLFPVMAVLLAHVLDVDERIREGGST